MEQQPRSYIPFALPLIEQEEIDAVVETLKSGWLSIGPRTQEFEKMFAEYVGVRHAIGLNSCTAALHLALLAHDIGPGDEVIVPSFTFAACANMVVAVGATPVFVDINETTYTIDSADTHKKITSKTKAIIAVHYAGHAYDIDAIDEIAKEHNLIVIEDAAHALGTTYKGKRIGSHNHTACYSFYPTKHITTGEGGMLTTDNDEIADFVRKNRLHGISKDAWKRYAKGSTWRYDLEYAGWKYNMLDLQAALGIPQLKKLDRFNEVRAAYAKRYDEAFTGHPKIKMPPRDSFTGHSYHLYPIQIIDFSRDAFIDRMAEKGIGTSVHFIPLHQQPFYRKHVGARDGDLPVTERIFEHIVSLPLFPKMSEDDVEYVISTTLAILS